MLGELAHLHVLAQRPRVRGRGAAESLLRSSVGGNRAWMPTEARTERFQQ